jgi:hypothetical protein
MPGKATTDPLPLGKVLLDFQEVQVHQSFSDFQPTPPGQFGIGPISCSEFRAPFVEPSRVSFVETDFSRCLQNLGTEIVLHKPETSAIANPAMTTGKRFSIRNPAKTESHSHPERFDGPQIAERFFKWRIKAKEDIDSKRQKYLLD